MMEAFLSQDQKRLFQLLVIGHCMVGATHGSTELFIKEGKCSVIQFHCIVHQKVLCARESSTKLDYVPKDVIKTVIYHGVIFL